MFTLTASMMTGIPQIDAEHRELVEIINTLAEAERHLRSEDAAAALERFRQELESHFQREEAHLESIRFPGLAAHGEHHVKTLDRLQMIRADSAAQTERPGGVATICFDELLRVVLKQDLEVVNWMADGNLRRK
ncbi:hemerythrin family protein [Ferrovibrio terrae]|uniref:bacteriohemerythrin n=1 Tax=Ferrovibrio terrae TaxID=2594003 RepID=UPI003137FFDC